METESINLSSPGIHLGKIIHPLSNQTISIVIPLSALPQSSTENNETQQKDDAQTQPPVESTIELNTSSIIPITPAIKPDSHYYYTSVIQKADKTKGCPFPTCSRYGRAFSRAHDLKRHIVRHEKRKERLCEQTYANVCTCPQCGETFINDSILQRHMKTHAQMNPSSEEAGTAGIEGKSYPCHLCKKRYAQFSKLQAHVATHDKKSSENLCALCGIKCKTEESLEEHMKEHTTSILVAQEALEATVSPKPEKNEDDDDDFLLEEMLLINKGPRLPPVKLEANNQSSSPGKIRCDYCSKTFKTKWTLSSHVAAHEGRYQFVCSRCGKKFVRKSHYDGHVRSHEAARPYVCEQCGKTFKEIKHRREHTKRKHPSNRNDVQNLLDSISAYVAEESSMEQTKFTLLMPMNFTA